MDLATKVFLLIVTFSFIGAFAYFGLKLFFDYLLRNCKDA